MATDTSMIETNSCRRRQELQFRSASLIVIGAAIVPTKGANECATAELKNDVAGSGFAEVLVRQ